MAEPSAQQVSTQDIFELTRQTVANGSLTKQDVKTIVDAARAHNEKEPLTVAEREKISQIVEDRMKGLTYAQLPKPLFYLSIFLIVTGVLGIISAVLTVMSTQDTGLLANTLKQLTATTIIVVAAEAICSVASSLLSFFVGLRLIKGNRGAASALLNLDIAVAVISLICEFMLYGIDFFLLLSGVQIAVMVALTTHLNPSLTNESDLRAELRDLDIETHAKRGTLGLADPGKGYIRLDFFNLFWIFVVGCVVGLIVEIIWHMVVVEPGVYQDRAGLLWGPFSPIYGIGGVLMTIALNRFKDRNIIFIFIVCTIIGGAFEYFVSYFMEVSFGAKAWDYSDQFLGDIFQGRTCLMFASMFGLLGTVWIKIFLPLFLKGFSKIPYQWRVGMTTVAAAFMLVNGVMTLQALDNWGARKAGHVPKADIEKFYAENFDDEWMQNRFQSMTIKPENSVRK